MTPLSRLAICAAAWLLHRAGAALAATDGRSSCSDYSNSTDSDAPHQCAAELSATTTAVSINTAAAAASWFFPSTEAPTSAFQLTIGIKSSVVNGAASRLAIRETWASELPPEIRVVFLGCQPVFSQFNDTERQRIQDGIATEQLQYGDLLIDELRSCRDAYDDLVNKVLAFFEWTTASPAVDPATTKAYVMVADDDVYVRLDLLRQLLMLEALPSSRFYGGQVWAVQFGRAMNPRRDPSSSKYYLPYEQYPMSELPPFANGPHYILSADVARLLGQHRSMFQGVGGIRSSSSTSVGMLDDVSVALWTLAMQIHPAHLPQFSNLRDFLCRNEMISLADITAAAMRQIHENLQAKRSFCSHFHFPTWLKRGQNDESETAHDTFEHVDDEEAFNTLATLNISMKVVRVAETHPVYVDFAVRRREETAVPPETVRLRFTPFSSGYYFFSDEMAKHVVATLDLPVTRSKLFCRQLRRELVHRLELQLQKRPMQRPILRLVQHNVASEEPAPAVTVAIAPSARYAMIVIECLLAIAYPGAEIFVMDEFDSQAWTPHSAPDIVVFAPTSVTSNHEKQHEIMEAYVNKYRRTSRMVMLGHVERVDRRVIVLSSRLPLERSERLTHRRPLYLPAASIAFAASSRYSPTQLLQSFHDRNAPSSEPRQRRFCIDQYAQRECDLPHRQYFSTLLNGLDHVDAVGACPGSCPKETTTDSLAMKNETSFYLDGKIELYAGYKFAIAFEDSVSTPGSVSDKMVAAFLAGAIPIYYGHSETATQLFNRRAFIDCGAFASLRACASHVLAVHASGTLYEALRREAPVVNTTAFVAFSWHPDVVDLVSRQRRELAGGGPGELLGEQLKVLLDNHVT